MNFGTRLKWAREAAGLTQKQLSEVTEIGISSISEFENDVRDPSALQMVLIGQAVHRSTDFFHQPGEPEAEVVLWRERPTDTPPEQIQVRLIELAEQFHKLERACGNPEPPLLEFATGTPDKFTFAKAESLAHTFRNRFAMGERPGQVLLRVLEDVVGVKVFFLEFEPSGTAACTLSERFGAAILLNSKNVSWRRNFDLAHELFHLLTWKVFRVPGSPSAEVSSTREEQFANCFAGHLLMPSEALKTAVARQQRDRNTLDFDDLFDIARQFAVSVPALVWQMKDAGIVDREAAENLTERIKGRTQYWEKRENTLPPKRPLRFEALAIEAMDKGLMGTGKFAEFMGITRYQAMKLLEERAEEFGQEDDGVEIEVIDS
jgi:XRE family transcriptional regulator, fatty acid utilization regulator